MVLDSLDEDALPGRMAYIDAGPAEIAMAEMVQPLLPLLLPLYRLQGNINSTSPHGVSKLIVLCKACCCAFPCGYVYICSGELCKRRLIASTVSCSSPCRD